MDRTEAAALGRADDAERWDGKRGGGTGSTFSDDPNPRGGRGVRSAQLVLDGPICMRLRPFFDRRLDLMWIVTTLNIALISAMRGCNAARAARRHAKQRRDHVLRENLREL